MNNFFFDTANVDFINNTWDKIKDKTDKSNVLGITTNPNALNKVGIVNIKQFCDLIRKLCDTIHDIRQDNSGIVYVQIPNSNNTIVQIKKYLEIIDGLLGQGAKIGLKLPPRNDIFWALNNGFWEATNFYLNVTGLCDAGTALKCLSYPIKYVSVLAGRMQDAGIDLYKQVDYIRSRAKDDKEIIAGSMRTLRGLRDTLFLGCIPTIGEKIWDFILEDPSFWDFAYPIRDGEQMFCPLITEKSLDLSNNFFYQMDEAGLALNKDFINNYC